MTKAQSLRTDFERAVTRLDEASAEISPSAAAAISADKKLRAEA
jgi:hypothetical protein